MSTETIIHNDQFTILLRKFNMLTENMPPMAKIASNLAVLRNDVVMSHELNGRQREALTERIDNYLKGEYGSTARQHTNQNLNKQEKK